MQRIPIKPYIECDIIHTLLRGKQKMPRGVKLRRILNLPTWAVFIVSFQFSLHNFAEEPQETRDSKGFRGEGVKKSSHGLYQNLSDDVANLVNYDTGDDAPYRVR